MNPEYWGSFFTLSSCAMTAFVSVWIYKSGQDARGEVKRNKHSGHMQESIDGGPWVCSDCKNKVEIEGPFTWTAHQLSVMFQGLKNAFSALWAVLMQPFVKKHWWKGPHEGPPALPELEPSLDTELLFLRRAPKKLDYMWIQDAERLVIFTPLSDVVKAAERRGMREYYRYYPTEQSKTSPTQAASAAHKPVVVKDLPD